MMEAGVPEESICFDHEATLPGFFRGTKRWGLAVIHEGELLAAIEFKSITSSFGNNLNNRTEEALGSPTCTRRTRRVRTTPRRARGWAT